MWLGGVCGGSMCGRGACMVEGHVLWEACVAGEMATAADGTHPTGMHSCSKYTFNEAIKSAM